jgi:Winged helix DNA-binding domain
MLEAASRIGGLQAQVMSSAELSLWARVKDLPANGVQRALWEDRTLVKTWAMRGTLHLLPSREYPTWQAALSTYKHYLRPVWFKHFDVTPAELDQLVAAIPRALDGNVATRNELAKSVARVTGSAKLGEKVLHSWGTLLKPAAFRGQLCFAPSVGQNIRFTRPDQWLPSWKTMDPDAALLEVTRRYLTAYAPSTPEDFGRWFALSSAQARRLFQALGQAVAKVEVDGSPAWMLTEHVKRANGAGPSDSVRLLPAFDQYVLGAPRTGTAFLEPALKARVYRQQGWISPVLLVNGRMVGVWRHERKGSRVHVAIELFEELSRPAARKAEAEAERLSAYLGGKLELEWVTSVGS